MMEFGPCSKEDKTLTIYNVEMETVVSAQNEVYHNSMIKKYTVNQENLKNCFF